jgi:hypothetical protein
LGRSARRIVPPASRCISTCVRVNVPLLLEHLFLLVAGREDHGSVEGVDGGQEDRALLLF